MRRQAPAQSGRSGLVALGFGSALELRLPLGDHFTLTSLVRPMGQHPPGHGAVLLLAPALCAATRFLGDPLIP